MCAVPHTNQLLRPGLTTILSFVSLIMTAGNGDSLVAVADSTGNYPRIFNAIPADDLYCLWNTADINPYRISTEQLNDSIHLKLVDSLECGFAMPVSGCVTSAFGPRRYRTHKGTDIDLETGDSVRCAFDGVVRVACYSGGYGNVIVVRHFNGLETVYAHLSKVEVVPGTPVDASQVLGLGGRTGRATGSHLHFEVRYLGMAIDPGLLIDFDRHELQSNVVVLSRKAFL